MENQYLTNIRFDELDLDPRILASLQAANFDFCSKIQADSLPLTLKGQDVTGQAQTGTGKTGAFLVAVFQHLLTHPTTDPQSGHVRCLILAPTRELAIQIARDAELLGKKTGLRCVNVYGGAAYEKQRRQFDKPVDLLIGTPGRLIDYWKQGVFNLKQVQAMVLDEADRMFDMGFIQDVRYLLRKLPKPTQRLNMLFSATLSQKVLELAYEHMNNPQAIHVEQESVSANNINEYVYFPGNTEKIPLLVGLIRQLQPERAIVFVNTKHNAEKVDAFLRGNALRGVMISGDVRQKKRERLLREFKEGKHQVLIATDVAARGLHIDDVTHVFNFDLPQMAEDYVHRIGRTARAGASGEAHSFACEDTAFYLPEIEGYTGKSIPVCVIDPDLLAKLERPQRESTNARGRKHQDQRNKPRSGNRRPPATPSGDKAHPGKRQKSRKPRRTKAANATKQEDGGEAKGRYGNAAVHVDGPGAAFSPSHASSAEPAKKPPRRRRRSKKEGAAKAVPAQQATSNSNNAV